MAFKNWFKSTHGSKWFSGIWFKSTHDSNDIPEFGLKLTHDSKGFPEFDSNQLATQKSCQKFYSNRLTTRKPFWNIIWINAWVNYTIVIGTMAHWNWLGLTFLGLSHSISLGVTFFRAFDSNVLPRNWFESTHDSSSMSKSWIDSTHD